jgi:hypothetical protein
MFQFVDEKGYFVQSFQKVGARQDRVLHLDAGVAQLRGDGVIVVDRNQSSSAR